MFIELMTGIVLSLTLGYLGHRHMTGVRAKSLAAQARRSGR